MLVLLSFWRCAKKHELKKCFSLWCGNSTCPQRIPPLSFTYQGSPMVLKPGDWGAPWHYHISLITWRDPSKTLVLVRRTQNQALLDNKQHLCFEVLMHEQTETWDTKLLQPSIFPAVSPAIMPPMALTRMSTTENTKAFLEFLSVQQLHGNRHQNAE